MQHVLLLKEKKRNILVLFQLGSKAHSASHDLTAVVAVASSNPSQAPWRSSILIMKSFLRPFSLFCLFRRVVFIYWWKYVHWCRLTALEVYAYPGNVRLGWQNSECNSFHVPLFHTGGKTLKTYVAVGESENSEKSVSTSLILKLNFLLIRPTPTGVDVRV